MSEPRFNYPNHPLFRIAPLLDRGFQTVLHDEYTSRLVGRIRAGRYTSELWDCNSFFLDYSQRIGSPLYRNQPMSKSRYEMTPEELRKFREEFKGNPEYLAKRAKRKEEEAARLDAERAWQERQAERGRVRTQGDAAWRQIETEMKRRREAEAILSSRWHCQKCKGWAAMKAERGGYALECRPCGDRAWGEHATFVKLLMAA